MVLVKSSVWLISIFSNWCPCFFFSSFWLFLLANPSCLMRTISKFATCHQRIGRHFIMGNYSSFWKNPGGLPYLAIPCSSLWSSHCASFSSLSMLRVIKLEVNSKIRTKSEPNHNSKNTSNHLQIIRKWKMACECVNHMRFTSNVCWNISWL